MPSMHWFLGQEAPDWHLPAAVVVVKLVTVVVQVMGMSTWSLRGTLRVERNADVNTNLPPTLATTPQVRQAGDPAHSGTSDRLH